MGSPFPGMDPYIEQPALWPDFHSDLAGELRAQLNRQIQPRYFARLAPYETYEIVEIGEVHGIRPDLGIRRTQPQFPPRSGSTATITPPGAESAIPLELPLTLYRVEIRQTGSQTLVTAIEILSPVNKRPGHEAHSDYLRKRRDLFRSAAHFLEIDLLRGGVRPPLATPIPATAYYAMLSREELRPRVEVWPIQLPAPLPTLPVPLLAPDSDAAIDLGAALASVYERGAYASQIDYCSTPPPPALSADEVHWVNELLKQLRSETGSTGLE